MGNLLARIGYQRFSAPPNETDKCDDVTNLGSDEDATGRSILDLNEYMLDMMLHHLSLADLSNLSETCTRLQAIVAHRFEKIYQNKLKLGHYCNALQPNATEIVSAADTILQSFGRYIEALSVRASSAFCQNAVSEQLLNIIEAELDLLNRSPLDYLKLKYFIFDEASIFTCRRVFQNTKRLSLDRCHPSPLRPNDTFRDR